MCYEYASIFSVFVGNKRNRNQGVSQLKYCTGQPSWDLQPPGGSISPGGCCHIHPTTYIYICIYIYIKGRIVASRKPHIQQEEGGKEETEHFFIYIFGQRFGNTSPSSGLGKR